MYSCLAYPLQFKLIVFVDGDRLYRKDSIIDTVLEFQFIYRNYICRGLSFVSENTQHEL